MAHIVSPYLYNEAVLPSRELLAGHVDEVEADHERDQRVVGVLSEGGHVLAQRVLKLEREANWLNLELSPISG